MVYVADSANNRVRAVFTNGTIGTVAGCATGGFTGDSGPAAVATLAYPSAVAIDGVSGVLYIADTSNNRIRAVFTNGTIATVAGNGQAGYGGGDGIPATAASLCYPNGVAVDGNGDVLVADTQNSRIRKLVSSTGVIVTIAGNGTAGYNGDGFFASAALVSYPWGIAAGAAGTIFFADAGNYRVRAILVTGEKSLRLRAVA